MPDEFKEKSKEPELVEKEDSSKKLAGQGDLIGSVIGGHYKIIEKIGEGGMSTVYKAHHLHLDRMFAVKMILPRFVHDENTKKRFQQEAQAASVLEHPQICSVKEYGITEAGQAYLVMEYVKGATLSELLDSCESFPYRNASQVMIQILQGLSIAHNKSVIHRDLKPANILVLDDTADNPNIKIADFGIAKLIRDDEEGPNLTKTGDVFGTPNYMSPEQCYGEKIDTRCDIYSLGCLFYELLSGMPPFHSTSALEIFLKQVNDKPDIDSLEIAPQLKAILYKALQKKPEERYQTADQFADDIRRYLDGQVPQSTTIYQKRNQAKYLKFGGIAFGIILTIAGAFIFSEYAKTNFSYKDPNQTKLEILVNDANTALSSKDFSKAKKNYKDAVSFIESTKEEKEKTRLLSAFQNKLTEKIESLIAESKNAVENSQFKAAEESLNKAHVVAHAIHSRELKRSMLITVFKSQSEFYKSTGNYAKKDKADNRLRKLVKRQFSSLQVNPGDYKSQNLPEPDSKAHALERAQLLKRKSAKFSNFGDFKSAEKDAKEALDLQEKWLGDSAAVADTLDFLGYLKVTQGKFQEADELWTRALDMANDKMKPGDTSFTMILTNNARMLHHKGKIKEAEALFKKAAEQSEKHAGRGSKSHIYALEAYMEFSNGIKNTKQAKELKELIVKLKESETG